MSRDEHAGHRHSDNDVALAAGDAIARELLAALTPMQFREAATTPEREAAFRLRYRAVLEVGMAEAARFADGMERDEYDDDAVHIVGWDGDRAIATCRLVLPAAGRPLPIEATYRLTLERPAAVVEWGRVVVDPAYRGDGHSLVLGLAGMGWFSMRERGYEAALGATRKRLLVLFDALGFPITVLGPPQLYWGEERYPFLVDGRPAIDRLSRQWLDGGSRADQ